MALIDNEELSPSELDSPQVSSQELSEEQPKVKIPGKYSGKSLEEIVTMHQEAEKLIGRQAQEVGEVRKLADELLKQQLYDKSTKQPQQEENEIDFFEDPKKAVQDAVNKHPDILAARNVTKQMQAMQTQAMLQKKHPDFAQVIQEGEFQDWVKGSSIRLNMYAMADSNYDFAAADELLSTFKQIRTVKSQQIKEDGSQALKQSLKIVGVDTGGSGESSQKVYRRADLIRLRMTDPNRYESLQPEILKAYQEGRVK
tara:strand:- start:2083 stop:2850 length:768 start_codon:yes stop_codon:yes gene_type:complete